MEHFENKKSSDKKGYTTRASHLIKLGQEDNAAWDEFYQKYKAMIFGIGLARNLSTNECEDLLSRSSDDLLQKVTELCLQS